MLRSNPRTRKKHLEELEQERFFQWMRNSFPADQQMLIFAIPNGGSRSKKEVTGRDGSLRTFSPEGARLKRQGVTKGVWDVFVSIPSSIYHGLYIEFKSPSGVLTPEQKKFQKAVESKNYKCHIARTYFEAKSILNEYLNESKS